MLHAEILKKFVSNYYQKIFEENIETFSYKSNISNLQCDNITFQPINYNYYK